MSLASDCAFSISESHDANYDISHSSTLVRVVNNIPICSMCIGRVLEHVGVMFIRNDWAPNLE